MKSGKLSLGPLLFNWDNDRIRDFYFAIADEAPVDYVYLGEVVCAKRLKGKDYFPKVIERLESAGKEVILSSLMLVQDGREMKTLEDMVQLSDRYLIEANDLSMISLLREQNHNDHYAIGPFINIYNEASLRYYENGGAKRISLPAELPSSSLRALAKVATSELEVQIFGRLPLAISARCFHARANKLHKDNCQFICNKDSDGLTVKTLDGQDFLTINGTQTMSHTYCNLMAELPELLDMGIHNFRISPHDLDMVNICKLYRDYLDGKMPLETAAECLKQELDDIEFSNGFFLGKPGRTLSRR